MATEKQIAANRRNAQKSTGPRTPEGKARSARNGRLDYHPLLSATIPMRGEKDTRFAHILSTLVREQNPTSELEHQLVTSIAVNAWRRMRLWGFETSTLSRELDSQLATNPDLHKLQPIDQAAEAYRSLGTQTQLEPAIHRDETRVDSSYYKAIRELRQMKKYNSGTQIDPRP